MKIKEVEVLGFKSFAEKTTLSFQPGITAIVGPNGCGKSNVIDAIRWAMGELSAKQLRGALMEDIIFNGSEGIKPTGVAEVSLIFSNDDGIAPPEYHEFSEIQVTRRLFRSGESEYYINKIPCRLKDIAELFMDTGLGTKTYSMVEQGKVEMILNSKPQDRRFLIEEAAGVTKYKNRKKEALSKIESTKQNLIRLSDIIGEIKRQISSLKRQAKKAEKYNSIKKDIKEIELTLALGDYREILRDKKDKEGLLEILKAKDAEISAKIQSSENRIEETKIRLLEKEKELIAIQERLHSVNSSIQKDENIIEYGGKELETIRKQQSRFGEDTKKLKFQLEGTEKEIQELEKNEKGLQNALVTEEFNLTERESQFKKLEEHYEAAVERIESEKTDLIDILTDITHIKNSITNLTDQQAGFLRREEKSKEELKNATEMIEELEDKASKLNKELEELIRFKGVLEEEKQKRLEEIDNLKLTVEGKEKTLNDLKEELNRKTARLNSLKEFQKNLEGYQEGVRSIMLKSGDDNSKKNGIYGVVADIIDTAPKYETALEAILGEKLQYIIVKSQNEGVEAIEYLKKEAAGRSSFIPLNLREEKGSSPAIYSAEADYTPLVSVVKAREGFCNIANYLLANVLVVEDFDRAMKFWENNGYIGTLVTLDGDVIDSCGVLTGGSKSAVSGGVLQKKREIRELEQITERIREEYNRIEKEYKQIVEETSLIQKRIEKLSHELYAGDVKILTLKNEQTQAYSELSRFKEKIEILNFERKQLQEEKEKTKVDLSAKGEKLQGLNNLKDEKERLVGSLQGEEKKIKEKIDGLRAGLTNSKITIGSVKERLKGASSNINRLRSAREALVKGIEEKIRESEESEKECLRIAKKIEDSQNRLDELLKIHKGLHDSLSIKKAETEEDAEDLRREESAGKTYLREQEDINGRLSDLNLKIVEIGLSISHLKDRVEEKYRIKLESMTSLPVNGFSGEEAKERLAYLKESLENMGEVNLLSIGEYEELKERYEFLTGQQDDLNQSLESLQKTINKINRVTRKRFNETFLAVNGKFKEIFPRLFGGGIGELVLTDEDDLLETGIEIVAQPPGKKLQNIKLLSGGEKALATIALIFSMFAIKPSPFCLLDEVDAALDDVNIDRFNELLLETSKNSQFILVTHNKQAMEIVDTLIGVTMENPGVSKLVSVKMN
ncbi:MAG: chromosome segregation protein SMC [Deltaproteobacteria bacterium CG12_big_fil_rev_8_21_14_0_65_43_10]|nr:MAG: chromosome segregation protein SMC [Deltaproteobacteria bacterium CG2_30_43_15]PIQ44443.1 MAG: chromosome segregation protein SMC [Deltaproteobacteria bacterium CG12_big_fil_rev_8_21_14_0_65_43_10]PIU86233.1 MAG: chromosome segregation protein SMC [Deltaproteobacteria bacterium CG06_land_8_20_14_3_00_44_19]PIX22501.1 MAG: chromosome segregation protein SMC [Deltaproteobacteria bacterium CG_4_8_14_3_um_filter_43_13]PIZ20957.1 MAG: chromosome segregation protein SMC [Deltaproteobacteria b